MLQFRFDSNNQIIKGMEIQLVVVFPVREINGIKGFRRKLKREFVESLYIKNGLPCKII